MSLPKRLAYFITASNLEIAGTITGLVKVGQRVGVPLDAVIIRKRGDNRTYTYEMTKAMREVMEADALV